MTGLMKAIEFAHEASGKIRSVESAVKQMSESFQDIRHSMDLSPPATRIIDTVTHQAGEAAVKIEGTAEVMEKIIQIIETIAGQSNPSDFSLTIAPPSPEG